MSNDIHVDQILEILEEVEKDYERWSKAMDEFPGFPPRFREWLKTRLRISQRDNLGAIKTRLNRIK